jgi:hypothetical protein
MNCRHMRNLESRRAVGQVVYVYNCTIHKLCAIVPEPPDGIRSCLHCSDRDPKMNQDVLDSIKKQSGECLGCGD